MGPGLQSPTTAASTVTATMSPSMLDLFILTFNCAKNLIGTSVFASHLQAALTQNATGLPDLVVFSLQEVAPISYAFIGSYFLNAYYARFGEALNIASALVLEGVDGRDGRDPSPPYTLVRAKNVGMTAILLYARDPSSIRQIEEAECGFGAADMGNKGAVGLRVTWSGEPGDPPEPNKTTELTFVAAHLAAMEWNLKKRNSNWRSIVSGLTFANPRSVLPGLFPPSRAAPTPDRSGAGDLMPPSRLPTGDSPDPSEEEQEDQQQEEDSSTPETDTHPLLPHPTPHTHTQQQQQQPDPDALHAFLSPAALARLQAISIYKPTSHLFLAGDLNYRIAATTPPPLAPFPSLDPASDRHFAAFFPRDQLTRERRAGRALHGLAEAPVRFPPTYKYDVLPLGDGRSEGAGAGADNEEEVAGAGARARAGVGSGEAEVVPWRWARHRWPGWCDRVLYLEVPAWVRGRRRRESDGVEVEVEVAAYDALPVVETSDHRAVFFRARVPLLGPEEMSVPEEWVSAVAEGGDEEEVDGERGEMLRDPRVRLPVPVDVHAWERRAAARRKEVLVGWSALLWCTKEGAAVLASALALGVGSWWLWRSW